MYRLQRAPRFQSVLCAYISRRTVRPISRWSSVDENTRPVRLVSPMFDTRRLATFALYTGCVGGYLYWLAPEVTLEVEEVPADEQGRPLKPNEEPGSEEDEFADSDSRFIPMTWATKLPRAYYKGSDPEWQEFRKLATDGEKQKRIYGRYTFSDIEINADLERRSRQCGFTGRGSAQGYFTSTRQGS